MDSANGGEALRNLFRRPIAHRGLHTMSDRGAKAGEPHRAENSMSSFRAAVEGGYAIECDLQLSADGTAHVFHDRTLDRMTGSAGSFHDATDAEIADLRLDGTDEPVPSLAQALEVVSGQVPLVLELKGEDVDPVAFVAAVARDLEYYDGPAAVMSFSTALTDRFRDSLGDWPRGLTAEGGDERYDEHMDAFGRGRLHFASYDVNALPCRFVTELQRREVPVITWTVRNPEQVARTAAHANQMTFEGFRPPVPPEPGPAPS